MPNLYPTVKVSRAGVAAFRGREMPWRQLGIDPDRTYFVLRPAEDLQRALRTFNGAPLLRRHLDIGTDHRRLQETVIGTTGSRALFRDGFVVNDVKIWDDGAIDDVKTGRRRELSVGFTNGRVEMVRGDDHDAIVRGSVVDHVCLCARGKLGSDCALDPDGDDWRWLTDALAAFR
jgi:hypothetical protein